MKESSKLIKSFFIVAACSLIILANNSTPPLYALLLVLLTLAILGIIWLKGLRVEKMMKASICTIIIAGLFLVLVEPQVESILALPFLASIVFLTQKKRNEELLNNSL